MNDTPTPAPQHDPRRFVHYAALGAILRDYMPEPTRCEPGTARLVFDMNQEQLDKIESNANCAITSMAHGIALIGQCLTLDGIDELFLHNLGTMGDLLATLGEAIGELHQIAEEAREGVAGRTA